MANNHEEPQTEKSDPSEVTQKIVDLTPNSSIRIDPGATFWPIGEGPKSEVQLTLQVMFKTTLGKDEKYHCVLDEDDLFEEMKRIIEEESDYRFHTTLDIEARKQDKEFAKDSKSMENIFMLELAPEYLSTAKALAAFKNLSVTAFLSQFNSRTLKAIKEEMESVITLNLD